MTAGFGILRLSPRAFWSMTPSELAAALAAISGVYGMPDAPTRDEFAALMRRFPDRKDHDHG
jgi:uncharacterized phage protein (TIGR02216 family)